MAEERILPLRLTEDSWHVLTVKWDSVPGYNYEEASRGMGDEDRRRELDLDWSATSGVLVYSGFSASHHVAKSKIRYDPTLPLYCGIDPGLTPAFVATQLNSYGQWACLSAIAPEQGSGLGTYEFGEIIAEHLHREYALPHGKKVEQLQTVWFGDPAGFGPPVRTATANQARDIRSHFDILMNGIEVLLGQDDRGQDVYEKKPGWGWVVTPGEMHINKRIEALRARLSLTLHHALPAFVVCPTCVAVKDALSSYHYKIRVDGRQELDPFKGWESHCVNCVEYICSMLFVRPDDEDEDRQHRHVKSMASNRRAR